MNKKFSVLLALLMVLSLSACNKKEEVSSPEETKTVEMKVEEKGEGILKLEQNKLYTDKDTVLVQYGYTTEGINPDRLSYIYINNELVEKQQLGDTQTSVELRGDFLKPGNYKLIIKQYENDDESTESVLVKSADYEIINK